MLGTAIFWLMIAAQPVRAVEGNLKISHFEITQGLQLADNSITLVAGKTTKVRVLPVFENDPGVLARVRGVLHLSRHGVPALDLLPDNLPVAVGPTVFRDKTGGSLVFTLPRDWTEAGKVEFDVKVSIDQNDSNQDRDLNDNRFPGMGTIAFEFKEAPGLKIGFLRVVGCRGVVAGDRVVTAEAASWMKAIFPIDPEKLVYLPVQFNLLAFPSNCVLEPDVIIDDRIYPQLADLKQCWPGGIDEINAWFPCGVPGKVAGHCQAPLGVSASGDIGISPDTSRWRHTLAHEVTHCLLNSSVHTTNQLNFKGANELGFDVEGVDPLNRQTMAFLGTAELYDYMNEDKIETETWVTPTSLELLEAKLRLLGARMGPLAGTDSSACPISNDVPYIGVGGVVRSEGAQFFPLIAKNIQAATTCRNQMETTQGQFELVFRAGNQVCRRIRWDPPPEPESASKFPFYFVAPNYSGLTSIELRYRPPGPGAIDGSILRGRVFKGPEWTLPIAGLGFSATIQKSAVGPGAVAHLSWFNALKVRLEATQAQLSTAAYQVHFSQDGQTNWTLVAANLSPYSSSLDLDLTGLPKSDHAKLKLIAADGFQMLSEVSGPFSLGNQIPLAMIVSPVAPKVTLRVGQSLRLVGAAYDPESTEPDHALDSTSLTWTLVGKAKSWKGSPQEVKDLPEGVNVIELVAEDANQGVSLPAKLTVEVLPASP